MTTASVAFPSVTVDDSGVRFKVVLADGLIVTVRMTSAEAMNLATELLETQEKRADV